MSNNTIFKLGLIHNEFCEYLLTINKIGQIEVVITNQIR